MYAEVLVFHQLEVELLVGFLLFSGIDEDDSSTNTRYGLAQVVVVFKGSVEGREFEAVQFRMWDYQMITAMMKGWETVSIWEGQLFGWQSGEYVFEFRLHV